MNALTFRQLDMLATRGISIPDTRTLPLGAEMSQNIDRASMQRGVTPAVLPKGFLLHCGLGRKILGYEALCLQGIRFAGDRDARLRFDFQDDLLLNLAGNAFNGQCASAACTTLFAASGWAKGQAKQGISRPLLQECSQRLARRLKRQRSDSSKLIDMVWSDSDHHDLD